MDCHGVQDKLLQEEDARLEGSHVPALAEHLASCAACHSFAARLARMEATWRGLPLPESEPARLRFLQRLPQETARTRRVHRPWRWTAPRWAVAAMLLLGIGLAAWFLVPGSKTHAAPALIESLIDWNLELAQACSPEERSRVYSARETDLKQAVQKTQLVEPERQLADMLLENGSWLAVNDDPVTAAERFSAVADKLVEQLQAAGDRKDLKRAQRYARLEARVAQLGVEENLLKVREATALDFEHSRRLEKIILSDDERMQALVKLLEENPNLSRKEIRKALNIPRKNPRKAPAPTRTEP